MRIPDTVTLLIDRRPPSPGSTAGDSQHLRQVLLVQTAYSIGMSAHDCVRLMYS